MDIEIRTYKEDDAKSVAGIYYNTIHSINIRDYSKEQINAWAPYDSVEDYSGWQKKLAKVRPFVATINETIVGFAEFEPNGHIDCFYVHHEYQAKGIGSALMKAIFYKAEKQSIKRIYAEVSITAKPFFKTKGFNVVKEQTVNLRGVDLNNFVMEKYLTSGLIFEQVTESQADTLVAFEQTIAVPRLYSNPVDLVGAIKELKDNTYYFIKRNGELVGTAAYCKREDGSCYISNMAVGPAHRGQGIARAALEFLLDKCGNAWRIDLVTHPENFRSIPLYESFGFVIESRIEDYYGDGEPRVVMVNNNAPAYGLRLLLCSTDIEWQAARTYRQKYFFDNVPIDDPYTWTFTHPDHKHFVLYNNAEIVGYAHIILWPENRAAMRIIVIDEGKRKQGFGKWFMEKIEEWVKNCGFHSLYLESCPDSLDFYTKLGYTPMPFNEPDGDECGPPDIAVGKIL